MASKNLELYFDPVSEGICEALDCSNPAKYRASWAQGVIIRLVCTTHKAEVEGKLFGELSPSTFGSKRDAKTYIKWNTARILIADDHQSVRRTIRSLLDGHAMQVCGEAEDGKEAIEKVKELKPDLVLLDVNMPVLSGVGVAYEIHRIAPFTKIVFFTVYDSPDALAAVRLVGVDAFVPKSAAGTELIPTLKRILSS